MTKAFTLELPWAPFLTIPFFLMLNNENTANYKLYLLKLSLLEVIYLRKSEIESVTEQITLSR